MAIKKKTKKARKIKTARKTTGRRVAAKKPSRRKPAAKKAKARAPKKRVLPKTLSGWIRASVKHVKRFGRSAKFVIDMDTFNDREMWDPDKQKMTGPCHLCFGGAGIVGEELVKPGEGTNGAYSTMVAGVMDIIRCGRVLDAVTAFYRRYRGGAWRDKRLTKKQLIAIDQASEQIGFNPNEKGHMPWVNYLKAADTLEAVGL